MLKVLLKKQFTELFRNFFYNQKTGKGKSNTSTVFSVIIYVLLMVGILGGSFTFLSITLCDSMVSAGCSWLYFLIMSVISCALGVFGSVFSTYNQLYKAKDNDLILSLPIPISFVLYSRLLGVYLMGLMYCSVVILPAIVVYYLNAKLTLLSIFGPIWILVLISAFVLFLSCILGFAVAKVSTKIKNKSFVTVFISLVFIIAYYFLYYKANEIIRNIAVNAKSIGEKIKGSAYFAYLFGDIGVGNLKGILIYTIVIFGLLGITLYFIAKSFLKTTTTSDKTDSKKSGKYTFSDRKSVDYALLTREIHHFLSSANYMLNCGLGILFIPALAIILLIKGDTIFSAFIYQFGGDNTMLPLLAPIIICALSSLNDMTAPSVSLEGKNIWLVQSLPVSPWQVLWSKLKMYLIFTEIPIFLCSLASLTLTKSTIDYNIVSVALPLVFSFFVGAIGLVINLIKPNLTWTNEIGPIKQSVSVFVALMMGFVGSIIMAAPYIAFDLSISVTLYLGIFCCIFLIADIILVYYLKTRGSDRFRAL